MKNEKKIVSLLLTVCMLLSVVPMMSISASAEEIDRTGWTKITGTTTISTDGNYYLDGNLTANITVGNGVIATIDLNGKTLTGDGTNHIITLGNGSIDVTVRNGTITMESGKTYFGNGAAIYIPEDETNDYDTSKDWTLRLQGVTITDCHATGDGGAIYVAKDKRVILVDCNLTGNSAGGDGGAICVQGKDTNTIGVAPEAKTVLLNTKITGNTAQKLGGGVYYKSSDIKTCFAAGTQVTMADGSYKNIEEMKEGDVVKTFDHESGTVSSAAVYLVYHGETKDVPFTLTFEGGKTLSIVGVHDLLLKDTRKYVRITEANAADYVGKAFYGEDGAWHELTAVTKETTETEFYSIYTSAHQNSFANGMLSCPDDVDYLLNIYELDENLKADEAQLAEDIAEYGLTSFEYMEEACGMTEAYYNAAGAKYYFIGVGKGLYTAEQVKEDYYSVFEEKTETSAPKLTESAQPPVLFAAAPVLLASTPAVSFAAADYESNLLTVGFGTQVTGNTVGTGEAKETSNLHLAEYKDTIHSMIAWGKDDPRTGMKIGLSFDKPSKSPFITDTAKKIAKSSNDAKYFFVDNGEYAVVYHPDGDAGNGWLELGPTVTYMVDGVKTVIADAPTGYVLRVGITSDDFKKVVPDTAAGQKFLGWFDQETGGTKITSISAEAKENVILYARFDTNSTVTLTPVAIGGYTSADGYTNKTLIVAFGATFEDYSTYTAEKYGFYIYNTNKDLDAAKKADCSVELSDDLVTAEGHFFATVTDAPLAVPYYAKAYVVIDGEYYFSSLMYRCSDDTVWLEIA